MAASLFNIKIALVSADTTFKEEAAGLAVHLHLNLQLVKDLGSSLWLAYDQPFREYAVASGVKKWGELTLLYMATAWHMHRS